MDAVPLSSDGTFDAEVKVKPAVATSDIFGTSNVTVDSNTISLATGVQEMQSLAEVDREGDWPQSTAE
jgi:hypothetical protein